MFCKFLTNSSGHPGERLRAILSFCFSFLSVSLSLHFFCLSFFLIYIFPNISSFISFICVCMYICIYFLSFILFFLSLFTNRYLVPNIFIYSFFSAFLFPNSSSSFFLFSLNPFVVGFLSSHFM
jgi:hypothetical protein